MGNLVAAGAISNAITASLSPLIPENFNEGQLVYYFYANIGFAIAMLVGYWFLDAFGPAPQPAVMPPSAMPALDPSSARSAISGQGSMTPRSVKEEKANSFVASFLAAVDHGASVVSSEAHTVALMAGAPEAAAPETNNVSQDLEKAVPQ